jgi:hypothetical protein
LLLGMLNNAEEVNLSGIMQTRSTTHGFSIVKAFFLMLLNFAF